MIQSIFQIGKMRDILFQVPSLPPTSLLRFLPQRDRLERAFCFELQKVLWGMHQRQSVVDTLGVVQTYSPLFGDFVSHLKQHDMSETKFIVDLALRKIIEKTKLGRAYDELTSTLIRTCSWSDENSEEEDLLLVAMIFLKPIGCPTLEAAFEKFCAETPATNTTGKDSKWQQSEFRQLGKILTLRLCWEREGENSENAGLSAEQRAFVAMMETASSQGVDRGSFVYPEVLDMAPYCTDKDTPQLYSLVSVVVYTGNFESGHYHIFMKRDPQTIESGDDAEWLKVNDEKVTNVTWESVRDTTCAEPRPKKWDPRACESHEFLY
eukprot:c14791_g1_i2.p1 GENE.c14791_g1_i2~~c14791_g1_i2.p1  ORF type:complete len:347 (+),score=80.51 c14791_g1_i2:77-1042(+)